MQKLMLLIGILLVGNSTLAQGEGRKERVKVKIEKYKERLKLSDNQVEDWKEMREKYKPELKAIRSDDSKNKADKMRAAADVIEKQEEELAGVLSEVQFAELKIIREEVKEKRMTKRGERKGKG